MKYINIVVKFPFLRFSPVFLSHPLGDKHFLSEETEREEREKNEETLNDPPSLWFFGSLLLYR